MKQASGNDSLVARGLYQSEREFRPTHQFWFQTNYRPGFDSCSTCIDEQLRAAERGPSRWGFR